MVHGPDLRPDPESALDVLAFVLCPAAAFAPGGEAGELDAVREIMRPMKAEAARRCLRAVSRRRRN
jgi:hypothetical protein